MRGRYSKYIGRFIIASAIFVVCVWFGLRKAEVFAQTKSIEPEWILDAGHGGEDGGAVSLSGIKESTINLDITLRLDQMLGFLGEVSELMRDKDISLHNEEAVTLREKKVSDLKNRVAAANALSEATLISIHQNTFSDSRYHGAQVFFARTQGSETLADTVQNALICKLQSDNTRQPKPIDEKIYLMNHIKNRAILIECGFLSNPDEEKLLQESTYQNVIAMVIAAALSMH